MHSLPQHKDVSGQPARFTKEITLVATEQKAGWAPKPM
jgi:hypothetical protein